MKLALFDFDGTITTHDSFLYFIKFYKGNLKFYTGFVILFPVLILYKLGLIKNYAAKEIVFTWYFKGEDIKIFQEKCDEFGTIKIPGILKQEALREIRAHNKNDCRVIIVTASAENWLRKWCDDMKIELIATRLEVVNGKITGKIAGKNCHGEEKVDRLKKYLKLEDFKEIYAYGDSKSDLPMMGLAKKAFYKPFV